MNLLKEQQIKRIILLFFPMIGISNYIAANYMFSFGKLLFTLYLVLLICVLSKYNRKPNITGGWPLLPLMLICLFAFGLFRTYLYDSHLIGIPTVVITTILCVSIIWVAKLVAEKCEGTRADKVLISSYHLYFILNFILFVVGFENPAVESGFVGESESIIWFIKGRHLLPLSLGVIDSSIISLIAGVGAVLLYPQKDVNGKGILLTKIYYIAILLTSTVMLALSGGRTAIALMVLIFIFYFFALEKKKKTFLLIITPCFFFCFLYLPVALYLYTSNDLSFLEFISRTGDIREVISLNQRVLIWGATLIYLMESYDVFHLLFGYGFYGQTISGAVDTYNFIFAASYASTETINVHSSILQILLNNGIIGVGLYYVTIYKAVDFSFTEANTKISLYLILLSILVTMMEAQLAVDSPLFMFFVFLVSYLFTLKNILISKTQNAVVL